MLRHGLATLGAVALAVTAACSEESIPLERAGDASTTSTSEPNPFGPIPDPPGVTAVRTPNGFVLPVVAEAEDGWVVLSPCANEVVVPGEPVPGAHVVIDPGHGGSEPGAVADSGLTEAEVNMAVAERVRRLLEVEGAVVELTRPTDVRVTIRTRAELAKALSPLVFVSIHHNAAPKGVSEIPGSELYHQVDDPASKRLAGLLFEELQQQLGRYGSRWAIGDAVGARARPSVETGDDFYGILRRSQGVPAVLSEAIYLTGAAEAELLATEEFRESEATAIAQAVLRYVTTDDPGSGYLPPFLSEAPAGGGGGTAGCEDPPLR